MEYSSLKEREQGLYNKVINGYEYTIEKLLPSEKEQQNKIVFDYLKSRNIYVKEESNQEKNDFSDKFSERLNNILKDNFKKKVLIIYDKSCGDDNTFRYFGLNIKEALKKSKVWQAEIFYCDDLDKIDKAIDVCSFAILIRMRQRPDVDLFIDKMKSKGKPVCYLIDDYCLGKDSLPFMFDALDLDGKDDFQQHFWIGTNNRFELVAQKCDCFIGSVKFLSELLSDKFNKKSFTINSTLNLEQQKLSAMIYKEFKQTIHKNSKDFILGYFSGTNSHNQDFCMIQDEICNFLDTHDDAKLLLVGKIGFNKVIKEQYNKGKIIILPFVDYKTLQYLQASVDVSLAPLVYNDFTNSKSSLKVYEAAAVGTPSLASNTYAYAHTIDNNVSGMLANSSEDWVLLLNRAYEDKVFLKKLGDCAYQVAHSKYTTDSLKNNCEKEFEKIDKLKVINNFKSDDSIMREICNAGMNWNNPLDISPCYSSLAIYLKKTEINTRFQFFITILRKVKHFVKLFFKKIKSLLYRIIKKLSFIDVCEKLINITIKNQDNKIRKSVTKRIYNLRNPHKTGFYDVLFLNGCYYSVPHPVRYRVDHQIEQLESCGLKCKKIDLWNAELRDVGSARNIIIFRAPYNDRLTQIIKLANKLNKKVYFDIDDLVIDYDYVKNIEEVKAMPLGQQMDYFDGVERMKKTLIKCGRAITTTPTLANELNKFVPEVFINKNVASLEMVKQSEICINNKDKHHDDFVRIGYFSGSITHNDDINLIMPYLNKVMNERKNVKLIFVGEISIPDALKDFKDRIEFKEFCDWRQLPSLISSVDINIAPIRDTLFNSAKSENKWTEASLVKVPTIASNCGAFKQCITNEKTGILCNENNEWYEAMLKLIDNQNLRITIAENAYKYCHKHYITLNSGNSLSKYIKEKQTPNIMMLMLSVDNTGGCMVAKKHCAILQKAGYDVTIGTKLHFQSEDWVDLEDTIVPLRYVVNDNKNDIYPIKGTVDKAVSTFWETNSMFSHLPKLVNKYYLVQMHEPDFYKFGDEKKILSNSTYFYNDVQYLTISKWCENWLKDNYSQEVRYAPNGIDLSKFPYKKRLFANNKIRILIEGDCNSEHKNVDEAFEIVNKLDKDKYEIWYLSYGESKKDWYKIDKFYSNINHDEVWKIYQSCDILLKTSLHESFSYPPLEMMATGGFVVVIPNDGNVEFLKDKYNCLMFDHGDHDLAISNIKKISSNIELQKSLSCNGLLTAKQRHWCGIKNDIIDLYR